MADVPKPAQDGRAQNTDIASLNGANIKDAEVRKLRAAGVRTVAELWEKVSYDGLGDLEKATKIEGQRLVELLPASLADELANVYLYRAERDGVVPATPARAKRWQLPKRLRARQAAGRAWTWLVNHLLDLTLLACVGLVGFLLLRAFGSFGAMPPPWGLGTRYVVAARDLKKDQLLDVRQLHFVRLPPDPNYFDSAVGLEGLILARDVPRQKPLRREDLLRLQVVATRDIAPGETLAASDLKLEWRPLQLNALLRADDAENARARLAIHKDYVVTEAHLKR